MPQSTTALSIIPSLSPAWQRVEEHYGAAFRFGRQAVEEAWRCGDALIAAKAETKHGDWLPALKAVGITPDTAERLRLLRRKYSEIPKLAVFGSVDEALQGKSHSARAGNGLHNNDDEWFTPANVVEACREALGGIDLDPASNAHANQVVKATRYFTAEDNGFKQPWAGRVFLNPPYSQIAGKAEFIAKLAESHSAGEVTAACVILSCDTSANWFDPLRGRHDAICLIRVRVRFYKPDPDRTDSPGNGSSIVYLGPDVARFAKAVESLGEAYVPYRHHPPPMLRYAPAAVRRSWGILSARAV